MAFSYNGLIYRDLEDQVRYDAEQVQLLKQADVTINENLQNVNENLQTINTEIGGKLTKPTNPSAESAVTMLADGTVGTKLLSEIGGGGKLYKHSIKVDFANNGELTGAIIYIVDYRTNNILETNPQICNKQACYCDATNNIGDGLMGICPVLVDSNNRAKILGVLDNTSTNAPEILNVNINFLKIKDTVTEL